MDAIIFDSQLTATVILNGCVLVEFDNPVSHLVERYFFNKLTRIVQGDQSGIDSCLGTSVFVDAALVGIDSA